MTGKVRDRFFDKVYFDPNSGCWIWATTAHGKGYGLFWYGGSNKRAHRISWELHRGPIPKGLCVLHTCDNPPCVNPDHLWLGTMVENNADRDNKGRFITLRGEAIGTSKLTEQDVIEIRASEEPYLTIAARFGVCENNVSLIRRRLTWMHVQ